MGTPTAAAFFVGVVLIVALLATVLVLLLRSGGARPSTLVGRGGSATGPTQADRDQIEQARLAALAELAQAQTRAVDIVRTADADAGRARAAAETGAREQLSAAEIEVSAARSALTAEQRAARDHDAERDRELQRREQRLDGDQSRLADEQSRLADERTRLTDELSRLSSRVEAAEQRQAELDTRQEDLLDAQREAAAERERVAGLTADAARAEVLAAAETATRRAAALLSRDIEAAARRGAERAARAVVVTAIQRVASEQTAESVVSTLTLPAEEMKGRIIGREGRNIRAFEHVTGVNVIIDDTPDTVVLSCFDPVRREVARVALAGLVADGRIHPHRIEEAHAAAERDVEAMCHRAAEDALVEVGIVDLHPELVDVLGRLRFRTSYGQNVLSHSVETAQLAGVMATELGLDADLLRRCAFLHDIGKALTHQVEGSHAIVGADLARRHGEHPDVVHAIEAHHNEIEPRTLEAQLTQAADAISGGRPGARRESLDAYVTRLTRLEEIGKSHPGVDRVYAMQAGREVKVMVLPDAVDDLAAQVMAREIAKQIEDELTYPGQIRVTVIRESRATEIAR